MSDPADDLWEQMDNESDTGGVEEEPNTPDPDEPWAKTSSGDADRMTSN